MVEPTDQQRFIPPECCSYLLSPDVFLVPLQDGTAQLVDLDGSFFGLSETAVRMLNGALDGNGYETVRRIAAADDVEPARVQADFGALIQTLRTKRLIRRADDPMPVISLRAAIALGLSYPVLLLLGHLRNQRLKLSALLIFARLCFSFTGWARTVEAWKKCVPATSIVLTSSSERERLIDSMDNAARSSLSNLPFIRCKERALSCWFMLHSAGVPVTLVMGVRFSPFSGHCWCEVDQQVLTDSAERCRAYTPIIRYKS